MKIQKKKIFLGRVRGGGGGSGWGGGVSGWMGDGNGELKLL